MLFIGYRAAVCGVISAEQRLTAEGGCATYKHTQPEENALPNDNC